MRYFITILFVAAIAFSFGFIKKHPLATAKKVPVLESAIKVGKVKSPKPTAQSPGPEAHGQMQVDPSAFVDYAKTFIGTPYLYASTDPAKGFDCSGFVYHVSRHFDLKVPRSSVEYTNYGTTVDRASAHAGDLILFTGTDASTGIVGHMGIVTDNNNGDITFIHSSSGKGKGVVYSNLEGYYETRFVKVVRIIS